MYPKIIMLLALTLTSACTITSERKTTTWYDQDGNICKEECESKVTVTVAGGSYEGSAEIMGNKVTFRANSGETLECTPKNNTALDQLKKAMEPCQCEEGDGDGAGTGGGSDIVAEEAIPEPVEPACGEPSESVVKCKATMSDSDWDCKRT